MNRRHFIKTGTAALGYAALTGPLSAKPLALKVGVTDWNINLTAKPTSIAFAQELGFDGVQVSLGRMPDHLILSDPGLQRQFIDEAAKCKFPIISTCLDILHQNYLKSDPLGERWVRESISITHKLNTEVILLPFFGKGALQTRAEMDKVADFLKEVAPEAEKAEVILGLENTISAEDNAHILDRAQSKAVQVYYDVGNSHPKFDIHKEIRWLGKDRICQLHLKDNPHLLGKGTIDFQKVMDALGEIDYQRWVVLETSCPSGSIKNDMRANLAFVRKLMA